MTYTLVLDKLMLGNHPYRSKVISERARRWGSYFSEMDRGVTMLSSETGYFKTGDPDDLQCNLNREVPRSADPHQ